MACSSTSCSTSWNVVWDLWCGSKVAHSSVSLYLDKIQFEFLLWIIFSFQVYQLPCKWLDFQQYGKEIVFINCTCRCPNTGCVLLLCETECLPRQPLSFSLKQNNNNNNNNVITDICWAITTSKTMWDFYFSVLLSTLLGRFYFVPISVSRNWGK